MIGIGIVTWPVRSSILSILDKLSVPAAAAFSLRKIRASYVGSLVRVRRSSDNVEADIGFTASGDLDTVALLAHCGAGSGFVVTWYDQSGNARHAMQVTAARQTRIVNAGVVDTKNGKPTVVFNGSVSFLTGSALATALSNDMDVFAVVSTTNAVGVGANWFLAQGVLGGEIGGVVQDFGVGLNGLFPVIGAFSDPSYNSPASLGSDVLAVVDYARNSTSGVVGISVNGARTTSTQTTGARTATNNLSIGSMNASGVGAYLTGTMSELIAFSSVLSTTGRQALERSQGTYYGVSVA